MPKGVYKRTPEHLKKLRQQCKNDLRLGFKKGNTIGPRFKKGNKIGTRFQKGNVPSNKGIQRPEYSGENHPNWKGGITKERVKIWHSLLYKLWRMSVFEKDDYKCVFCGSRNSEGNKVYLEADHIKPFALYPKLRFDLFNGRTLCRECHRKTPTYGAKKMYAR